MPFPQIAIRLPDWTEELLAGSKPVYATVEDRMRLVVDLSHLNSMRGDSGPFAAAVFEMESGTLLAPGVNLVVPARNCVLHAEIVAIMIAQQIVGRWDLGAEGMPPCELASSSEPCAMCLGAIPWSGVRRLVCGARDEDVRAIGFDEGLKPDNWLQGLEDRGIAVVQDVLRDEARTVLRKYAGQGGVIYNGRQTGFKPSGTVTPDE
jgi:tRNA(Arg) A34 adenosine deaminase TadA